MSSITLFKIFLLLMIFLYIFNSLTKGTIYSLLEFDSNKIIKDHQYYRLLSFGFLHGNLVHLIGNILILNNIIYPFFQTKLSFSSFIGIFLLSSFITGIALILYYSKNSFTFVGSSVGFYSFFGFMFIYFFNHGWSFFIETISHQPFYTNGLLWAIFVFILGNIITSYWENFQNFSGVFAHNISFIVGLIIAIFIHFD